MNNHPVFCKNIGYQIGRTEEGRSETEASLSTRWGIIHHLLGHYTPIYPDFARLQNSSKKFIK